MISWSTGATFKNLEYSDTLNPGVFSSCESSKVLSHEENTPVFVLSIVVREGDRRNRNTTYRVAQ